MLFSLHKFSKFQSEVKFWATRICQVTAPEHPASPTTLQGTIVVESKPGSPAKMGSAASGPSIFGLQRQVHNSKTWCKVTKNWIMPFTCFADLWAKPLKEVLVLRKPRHFGSSLCWKGSEPRSKTDHRDGGPQTLNLLSGAKQLPKHCFRTGTHIDELRAYIDHGD